VWRQWTTTPVGTIEAALRSIAVDGSWIHWHPMMSSVNTAASSGSVFKRLNVPCQPIRVNCGTEAFSDGWQSVPMVDGLVWYSPTEPWIRPSYTPWPRRNTPHLHCDP
jgi:hypothetical protein